MKRRYFFVLISLTWLFLSACWSRPSLNLEVHSTANKVKRGKEIVRGLGACGSCHGVNTTPDSALAGGRELVDNYGLVIAANLTPSVSGIGNYNLSDFIDAIRLNKSKKTEVMSGYFHRGLKKATDEDLAAIYAYLQTLTPVKNEITPRKLNFLQRNTTGIFEERGDFSGYIPPMHNPSKKIYGKYLIDRIADCAGCHQEDPKVFSEAEYLGGGKVIIKGDRQFLSPSLKSKANPNLRNWREVDFVRYLQSGRTTNGLKANSRTCPTNFYATAPVEDLQAIAHYLVTLQ